MGFFLSKRHVGGPSLLTDEEETCLQTGDILLVESTKQHFIETYDMWQIVALYMCQDQLEYVFTGNSMIPLHVFTRNHEDILCRPLNCVRTIGFERLFHQATKKAMALAVPDAESVAHVLACLGFVSWNQLRRLRIEPKHFATESTHLTLDMYNTEPFYITF